MARTPKSLTNEQLTDLEDLSNSVESFILFIWDETTDLTTWTAKVTFRIPYQFNVTEVRASVTTAPTWSAIIFDINRKWTSILSSKLRIDNLEKSSESGVTPPVISDSSLANDDEITIDIDAVWGTTPWAGAKVTIIGKQTFNTWLLSELVSYYEFENNVTDSHWSNNGTDNWTSDVVWIIDRARSYDWIDDFVSLADFSSYEIKSISWWGYIDSTWTFNGNSPFFSDFFHSNIRYSGGN